MRFLFFPPTGNKTKKIQKKGRKRSQEEEEEEEEEEETHTHTKHSTERDIESEKKLNQNTRALLRALLLLLLSLRARFIIAACFKRIERGFKQTYTQTERERSLSFCALFCVFFFGSKKSEKHLKTMRRAGKSRSPENLVFFALLSLLCGKTHSPDDRKNFTLHKHTHIKTHIYQ